MQEISYKVKSYAVEYFGNSESASDSDQRARLMLFSDDVKGIAAELRFYQSQKLWLKHDSLSDPSAKKPTLICHLSTDEIVAVLDTLRNEKPIYVAWSPTEEQVSLRTFLEPVGEGEK